MLDPVLASSVLREQSLDMTVRDATLDLFRSLGMTTIFGNPGSTELPMFRDFPADFRYVLGLQESIVIAMADGFAQATRNAALVNLHSAAGVGHALGNLFTAYRNQTPLVVTAGQQARSILLYEPFLYAEQATEFPKPYVKWSCEPARAADVPQALARAYYIAMQAPQGPTFVSIPVDDWDRPGHAIAKREVSRAVAGDPSLLAEAGRILAAAARPAVVVGAGVARDGAWNEAIALAERHNASVWASPMSQRNAFPETHPLFAGFLLADRRRIVAALKDRDVILVVGAPAFTHHVEGEGPFVPEGARLIQLVDNPDQAAWTPTGMSIVTDAKLGLAALLAADAPAARGAPPKRERLARLSGAPMTDAYVMQEIARLRPKDSVIVEEAPSSRSALRDYLPIDEADGFYTCASGGLGHGLPAAVGVALGRGGRRVVAIIGDGSALYAIQGLWSAVQWNLPITFVIVRNGCYEALHDFGRHFGLQETVGTSLPGIDFCALAEGQGMRSIRAAAPAALDEALKFAFSSAGPSLIEAVVETVQNRGG